jgi:hypothetical protein
MIFPPSWLLHPTVKGAQVHEELGAGQAGDVVRLDTVTEIEARRRFTIGFGNVCGGWPSTVTEKSAPRTTR